jgi:hypothetical protein
VLLSFALFWKGVMQMQSARVASKEFTLGLSRQLTKVIMTKMEILQNNKIERENETFTQFNTGIKKVWVTADNKKHMFQSLANVCFDGCRVFLFL